MVVAAAVVDQDRVLGQIIPDQRLAQHVIDDRLPVHQFVQEADVASMADVVVNVKDDLLLVDMVPGADPLTGNRQEREVPGQINTEKSLEVLLDRFGSVQAEDLPAAAEVPQVAADTASVYRSRRKSTDGA